jgi:predicted kinase
MVGLPGAGKTTLAREIERQGALRLTPDEWMEAMGIPLLDEPQRARIEALLWRVAARALELGVDVVLDFGFWSRAERDDFRSRARALGADAVIHFLDAPMSELVARNAARRTGPALRGYASTEEDLARWAQLFEPPTSVETYQVRIGRVVETNPVRFEQQQP